MFKNVCMAVASLAIVLGGCAHTPKIERPPVELPQSWRDANPDAALFEGNWWRIYQDPVLDRLVTEALERNANLAIATARVDESRSLMEQARAALFPTVDAGINRSRTENSLVGAQPFPAGFPRTNNDTRATLNVSYELDLWGRLRNTAGAARSDLLATDAARQTVRITLIVDVVKGYYALRALDAEVDATQRAVGLREDALKLQQRRSQAGEISQFEMRQLEAEAAAVRAQLPPLRRDRDLQEAALAVLLGRSPRAIFEGGVTIGQSANDGLMAPVLPAGVPSELLLKRPDFIEAEQRLAATQARVAVARAAYLPSITLTGYLGSESSALSNLFTGPAGIWQFAANLAQPIFAGGSLAAAVGAAKAREQQAISQYQYTVQNGFREVRAALVTQSQARESFEAESVRSAALTSTLRLAKLRFQNGLASQLDVIDAERNLLTAENSKFEALRAQRAAIADCFKALGAGAS